jgi:glutamate synthase (NADPH/NADH) large chain
MVQVEEIDDADAELLQELIGRHVEETGSSVGRALLDGFARNADQFRKVMPVDFKRVLEATARAEAEGRDPIEAVMDAART